jgi:hypothetical protein
VKQLAEAAKIQEKMWAVFVPERGIRFGDQRFWILLGLVAGHRNGFLAQHVLARRESRQGDRAMQMIGGTDDHSVHIFTPHDLVPVGRAYRNPSCTFRPFKGPGIGVAHCNNPRIGAQR